MKKFIAFLLFGLSFNAYADTKISALPSTTTLNSVDIIPVVTNPGTSPANYSITKQNLITTLGIGAISTNTILNQSTLQSGSTFYVSSGTVNTEFHVSQIKSIGTLPIKLYDTNGVNQLEIDNNNPAFQSNMTVNTKESIGYAGAGLQNNTLDIGGGLSVGYDNIQTPSLSSTSIQAAGVISGATLQARNIASGTQCVHADSSGNLTGTGSDCGSGGGGGVTVYPATATASFPFGLSASTISVSTITVANSIQLNGTGNLSFVNTPDGKTYQVIGSSISSCTAGQTWVVGSSNTAVCVTPVSSGGGGSSSLQVTLSGVQITSPTASINLYSGDFQSSSAGTTAQIYLNPGTTDFIQNTSALQSGATFYISSGTVKTLNVTTSVIASSVSVNGPLNFSTYQRTNNSIVPTDIAVMNSDGYAFGFTNTGYVDDTLGYKINNTNAISKNTNTWIIGNSNAGSASGAMCLGDSTCGSLTSAGTNTLAIGKSAMLFGKPGSDNMCIGASTCQNLNLTSAENTAVGTFALGGEYSGSNNVAIGWDALHTSSGSVANTCVGWDSCDLVTTGGSNVAIGNSAMADVTTGFRNTCVGGDTNGFQPCQGLITGSSNTALGAGAAGKNFLSLTGAETANTLLGYAASMASGVNKSICLGYNCAVSSSNTIEFGGPGIDAVTVNISSGLTLSHSAGTNGQVLTSGGAGTVPTWTTISGGGGGSSSLAVTTGTASGFSSLTSSPTAVLNFNSSQFAATLTGSATAYIQSNTQVFDYSNVVTVRCSSITSTALMTIDTATIPAGILSVGSKIEIEDIIRTTGTVAFAFQQFKFGANGLVPNAYTATNNLASGIGYEQNYWDLDVVGSSAQTGIAKHYAGNGTLSFWIPSDAGTYENDGAENIASPIVVNVLLNSCNTSGNETNARVAWHVRAWK